MRRLGLLAVALLAACDVTPVAVPIPGPVVVPGPIGSGCLYRTYHDPLCDGDYSWAPGYYNPAHVWITPRYVRRAVIVTPPVVVRSTSVTGFRSPSVTRATVVRTTVRSTTAYSRPRVTTTTTRRYR